MRDLWAFATHLYGQHDVERHCLAWQAQGGDVCLLLCAAWLDREQVPFSAPRWLELQALSADWQKTWLAPMRALRQQAKAWCAEDAARHALRERLKALELDSERALLAQLAQAVAAWPSSSDTAGEAGWLVALGTGEALRARLRAAGGF